MGGHKFLEMQWFFGHGLFDLDTGIPRTAATSVYSDSIHLRELFNSAFYVPCEHAFSVLPNMQTYDSGL